jgi:hypothetical protein
MKKILAMGLLALSLAVVSEQQASAWVNCKFGVGLNWNWQSGGNNFLWGLFRNGQPPSPDIAYPGHGPAGYPPGYIPPQQTFPGIQPYGPYDFQYFGRNPQGTGTHAAGQAAPTAPVQQTPTAQQNVSWYGNSLYQPASYSADAYSNYYNAAQNYYGSSQAPQAPSYWYGR